MWTYYRRHFLIKQLSLLAGCAGYYWISHGNLPQAIALYGTVQFGLVMGAVWAARLSRRAQMNSEAPLRSGSRLK